MEPFYSNEHIYIEIETADIPWLKIFARKKCKEFTDCDPETRREIFRLLEIIEKEMIAFYKPDKINIASFANYIPQVHWHIMARYKNDSHFPEPMWGIKQRDSEVACKPMVEFIEVLLPKLYAD